MYIILKYERGEMDREMFKFDIYPKIVKIDSSVIISVVSLEEGVFLKDSHYKIQITPLISRIDDGQISDRYLKVKCFEEKLIQFEYNFLVEQEYIVRMCKIENSHEIECAKFSLYALEDDLYHRLPLKGDFHSHSCESDGKERPEIVASRYRERGYDFFALTDHEKYYPSLNAKSFYEPLGLDFLIVPGEEVHSPNNHVHIINFGGHASVNELFQSKEGRDTTISEICELKDSFSHATLADEYVYNSCQWVCKHIAEVNGLSIFCHPFWQPYAVNVQSGLTQELIRSGMFDAFELVGGQTASENSRQIALYNDIREQMGYSMPIVGSSDSHGTVNIAWFDYFKSLVFSKKNEVNEIIESVKNGYCVAIESYPDEQVRVYGSFRLVNYGYFLLNNWFPLHDFLCLEEGKSMREYYLGQSKRSDVEKVKFDYNRFVNKYFSEGDQR